MDALAAERMAEIVVEAEPALGRVRIPHPGTGEAEQRHAAVEQDLGGIHILHQVEIVGVRPVPVVAAPPDDGDLVGDRRFQQQRGGDVGRAADSTVL